MEVINLSYSQKSNHVLTHLYNTQESHIPYTKNAPVNYHNGVFLQTTRSNNHTNYSPRALIYDFRGGMGALNKYEYFETAQPDLIPDSNPYLSANKLPQKNQYQKNLDLGITNNAGLLHVDNTTYWSDYNKLIMNPRSLQTLTNFEYPGHHKHFNKLKFDSFKIGQEEYTKNGEDLDDFRHLLEKCDHFQGIQSIVDIDSAWGGYSDQMLTNIFDEYFNDNNKVSLWIYGLINQETKISAATMISRIKSIIELSKHASLFFPISPDYNSNLISSNFDATSNWHSSALPAAFINGLWNTINQTQSTSMSNMEDGVLQGYGRKFVNEIKISPSETTNAVSDVDISSYYNLYGNIDNTSTKQKSLGINLSQMSKEESQAYYSRNYIQTKEQNLSLPDEGIVNSYECNSLNDITTVDSFPDILNNTNYYLEFHVSNAYRDTLRQYKKTVQNVRPHHTPLMDLMEDKYELVEDISRLIDEYTEGYHDSEDEDDY